MSKHQDFRDFVLNHEFEQFAKIEDGRATFHLWQDEYEALQSAMATNAGGLSTIAQSKLEQMGATVHGVLVKNEAGAWAAVSDAGRVMWLDDFEPVPAARNEDVALPSHATKSDLIDCIDLMADEFKRIKALNPSDEISGLCDRALQVTEQNVPVLEIRDRLQKTVSKLLWEVSDLEDQLEAARAQGGQGAEPEGFDFDGWYDKHQSLFREGAGKSDLRAAYKQGYRDSHPQPQGDGWISMADRHPTKSDEDCEGKIWLLWPDRRHFKRVFRGHVSCSPEFCWMPTGLKRPQPPAEREKGDVSFCISED